MNSSTPLNPSSRTQHNATPPSPAAGNRRKVTVGTQQPTSRSRTASLSNATRSKTTIDFAIVFFSFYFVEMIHNTNTDPSVYHAREGKVKIILFLVKPQLALQTLKKKKNFKLCEKRKKNMALCLNSHTSLVPSPSSVRECTEMYYLCALSHPLTCSLTASLHHYITTEISLASWTVANQISA